MDAEGGPLALELAPAKGAAGEPAGDDEGPPPPPPPTAEVEVKVKVVPLEAVDEQAARYAAWLRRFPEVITLLTSALYE